MVTVVGRSYESQAITGFLESAGTQPSALLIEGEAGVGKSTLWLAAIEKAGDRGFHTLSAGAPQAESVLEYGAVADLLADLAPEVFNGLPDVQKAVIDRVLLRADSEPLPGDWELISEALMFIIQRLSTSAPVLVAVDDLQWLDHSSRAVIDHMAWRLPPRAALLGTARPETDGASATAWLAVALSNRLTRLRVDPMCMGDLHKLLFARLGKWVPRPTMRRIAEISAGNPFYALELARGVACGSGGEHSLPRSLANLVSERVGDLSPDARQVLLAAACAPDPTVELLARAIGASVERTVELLGHAERQKIVVIDGNRVRYSHPLLARGVYTSSPPAQRRQIHSALADILTQPELKVRHLALAASSHDPELLRALDGAADTARARGAPADAAELLDLAIKLGGDTPSRRTRSAENHLRSGDPLRAGEVLAPTIEQLSSGPERAVALNVLAGAHMVHSDISEAAHLFKRAADDSEGDPSTMIHTLLALAFTQSIAGDYDGALQISRRAVNEAEKLGVPALQSQALANYVTINALDGNGIDESALSRALELEDPELDVSVVFHASAARAQALAWTGRLDEARAELMGLRQRCVKHGADSDLIFVSVHTAMAEIWRGRFADAAQAADEAVQLAEQLGGEHLVSIAKTMRAAAAAFAGREDGARSDIAGAVAAAERSGMQGLASRPASIQGFLEVSLGNYAAAATALEQCCRQFPDTPGTEIVTASFIPDAVEALVALGRCDEAEPMIKALEHNGRVFNRRWMLAIGARCRAMVLGALGEVDAAERILHEALILHGALPMPFERARTQLFLGQIQRRRRLNITAAATIGEALRAFESMGSELWAERARAELERTSTSRTHGDGLTPSERRVAELLAAGMTSAEAAAQLCISAKTVEANLTRIYRKLDIHSRAELHRFMAESA
jgi:DNA-binding CsgD family transcriptional regulator/tetratricopeptide (TPR) repeat protein